MNQFVALFDLDKTLYKKYSLFEIADSAVAKGLVSGNVQKQLRNTLKQHKDGKLTYNDAANQMLIDWAKALKGMRYDSFYQLAYTYFKEHRKNFYSYVDRVFQSLKNNYDIYIVTTNTKFAADSIVSIYKLSGSLSTIFEVVDGAFTGKIFSSLAYTKDIVKPLINKYGKHGSIAVGDSMNDVEMLDLVEYQFCFQPDESLDKYASKKRWTIINNKNAYEKIEEVIQ